jgi:imidazole glycerol phosphate synthase glutamine amidotransferase subunit
MRPTIVVIQTGIANTASVLAALSRLGAKASLSDRPSDAENAGMLVLPGVGSFGAGVHALTVARLLEPLRERLHAGRPTLCICLGMQMLFEQSEESPGVRALGVVRAAIGRFRGEVRVPQLGWNHVEPPRTARFLTPGHAYFANSYRATEAPAGWSVATSDHGERFVAAMERGNILACQFHPELSGAWGLALIKRWIERVSNGA